MKQYSIISILLMFAIMACNSKTSDSEQENESSLSETKESETKEMVQYLTPKQKSIHLFNLPDGVTERQFSAAISEINSAITELGYSGVGYHLYKVEADTIKEYRYFMEGLWPDPETYKIIHDSEDWNQAVEKNREMLENVFANQIYRRILKVDMNK